MVSFFNVRQNLLLGLRNTAIIRTDSGSSGLKQDVCMIFTPGPHFDPAQSNSSSLLSWSLPPSNSLCTSAMSNVIKVAKTRTSGSRSSALPLTMCEKVRD